jgi:N-sulfoglucosamine sulfohydrolase
MYGVLGIMVFFVNAFSQQPKADWPNILLIVSEDHGQHLSCYGDDVIKTPNLDQIAGNGFRFKNAYVSQAVCSPSRSTILSGLYPHQTGHFGLAGYGFRYVVPVNTIYTRLKAAGYRTGMIGKLHVEPASALPIDFRSIPSANYERKDLPRYAADAGQFMSAGDEPFFLMVNYPDAHWPFLNQVDGQPKQLITEDQVKPWPYLAHENKIIRAYTAAMYNGIKRLDDCVGELMQNLERSGKARNTLVIYLSDHGDEFARGKFDIYEAGTKVPFLISWPGKINKGVVSEALVSTIDLVPTMLDVAGLPAAKELSGKSLIPLLKNPGVSFRQYLFTEKNVDQVDLYYPRRAVRDKKYKLIYSLLDTPRNIVAYRYLSCVPTSPLAASPTLQELETTASPLAKKIYHDWLYPNKFQLYDLENDPWEFNDLSGDPQYDKVKKRLLNVIYQWQKDTDDPFRFPEKVQLLTKEVDTIKVGKDMQWQYPHYMYGK